MPVLVLMAMVAAGCLALRERVNAAPDEATRLREADRAPDGMVYVPGGSCVIGTDDADADDDARPARRVFVASFYIDRTEVTNAEYRRFDLKHAFVPGEEAVPVTNVTYDEAAAYARWAGKRLPTEEEWEKAARGAGGRRYPWGEQWDGDRVPARPKRSAVRPVSATGCPPSRLTHVGSEPQGVSPYGCLDMAGNAWEWVQGFYRGNRHQRILRGGAVGYGERACRSYHRAIEGAGAT